MTLEKALKVVSEKFGEIESEDGDEQVFVFKNATIILSYEKEKVYIKIVLDDPVIIEEEITGLWEGGE